MDVSPQEWALSSEMFLKASSKAGLEASESPESEIGVMRVRLTGSFVKASLRLVHTGRGHQHPGCICAKTLCKMELVSEI